MVLDKYEVLQRLGEGATATVFRGRHTAIGRDVAIKILHPHLSASSRYRERFNREARAVGRLSHPNIVSILDYSGPNTEDCYIVTELVDGETLLSLLQAHGKLPAEITVLIGLSLTSALQFAHTKGIIHRDLKPENIMLRRDGVLKLMDFGVARVVDEGSITMEGSLLGSPAYMSPQQALDEPIDGRSDLFSLGTVLFHTVTGHVPFSGTNASVILRNIIEGNRPEVIELAADVSPALASIIDKLLRPKAEDRYNSAQEVYDALLLALAESKLPIEHPVINLHRFLVEPDVVKDTLNRHLKQILLEEGRSRLSKNDHLGALQLLNRLLAIDEDNEEVLSLIQSLHQPPAKPKRSSRAAVAAAGLAISLAGLAWFVYSQENSLFQGGSGGSPTGLSVDNSASVGAATSRSPDVEKSSSASGSITGSTNAVESASEGSGVAIDGQITPNPTVLPPLIGNLAATPTPGRTVLPGLRPSGLVPEPTPSPSPAPELPSLAPGELVITSASWAEVLIDGKKIGYFRKGPVSEWVGSPQNPILLTPGTHTVTLKNDKSNAYEEQVTISAGEHRTLRIQLIRKPVTFLVNQQLPRTCTLTVGSTYYSSINQINGLFTLTDPEPSTPVVFDCPSPFGKIVTTLGPTEGGESIVLPASVSPAGGKVGSG